MSDEDKVTNDNQVDLENDIQTPESNELENKVEQLQNEMEEHKNKYIRLMADFQNYQRRVNEEKATFGAIANMSLIQDILEVFDDISLALQDDNLDLDQAKSSMKIAQDKLVSSIERTGVERIEVNQGDEFNKDTMEAISTIPVQEDDKKGKVVAVISSAFKYKGKDGIIKAAKVIVGK